MIGITDIQDVTGSRDKLVTALVVAADRSSTIIGNLHALHYHGQLLRDSQRREAMTEARAHCEEMLVAILAAEQSMEPV
jgi:hypothetical protein